MTAISFKFDWIDAASSPDLMSHATMATLEIRVDGQLATTVIDNKSRSYREHVIIPLYPVAEWIVSNWWSIWHEQDAESPNRRRAGFAERHDLWHAGDGFLLPSLTFAPFGAYTNLVARPWRPHFGHIEFNSSFNRHVSRLQVEEELRSVVDAVLERLRESGLESSSLSQAWNAVNGICGEELEFCIASALLGIDPFETDGKTEDTILTIWMKTEPSLREDLLACADIENVCDAASWTRKSLAAAQKLSSGNGWASLRKDLGQPAGLLPWERGYELARKARILIKANGKHFEFSDDWAVGALSEELPTDRMDGLVADESPSCVLRNRRDAGRRFLLARAVGDYLDTTRSGPSLLTSLSSDRQSQSRAFAAEFLAPSAVLSEKIGSPDSYVDPDAIEDLAQEFQVSTHVIQHQIRNHKLGIVDSAI